MKSSKSLKAGLQKQFFQQQPSIRFMPSLSQKDCMDLEAKYGCNNYLPLPVVIDRGQGAFLFDVDGKRYHDWLAGYSSVNQGHSHPRLVDVMVKQASKLTITGRALHNSKLGIAEKYLAEFFGYDKVLFMNSGSEAGESAVKFARRWAYEKKGIPENQAQVLFPTANFWGRTIAACGSSDDPERYKNFGPYDGLGFHLTKYGCIEDLEQKFASIPNLCAYMLEPIQGEAGAVVPPHGYLKRVRELCDQYNVLMISDEVQAGLGRAGKKLATDWEEVRPDIVNLGKSLSGGFYPISCILCDDHIMECIRPGDHGSTFGGSPLAAAIVPIALDILKDEGCYERSVDQGERFRHRMSRLDTDFVTQVRGKGLMNTLVLENNGERNAWNLSVKLMENGILSKSTQGNKIRFTPPLIMSETQFEEGLEIIAKTIEEF